MSPPIERAYELARSGQCKSVAEIMRRLSELDREAVEVHLAEPAQKEGPHLNL